MALLTVAAVPRTVYVRFVIPPNRMRRLRLSLVTLLLFAACAPARTAPAGPDIAPGLAALRWTLSEAFDGDWELRITTIAGDQFKGPVSSFYPNGFQLGDARIALDDVASVERRGTRGYILDLGIIFGGLAGAVGYIVTSGAAGSSGSCSSPCREQRIAIYTVAGLVTGGIIGAILKPGSDHELLWQRH
jgi:hypothetical protein